MRKLINQCSIPRTFSLKWSTDSFEVIWTTLPLSLMEGMEKVISPCPSTILSRHVSLKKCFRGEKVIDPENTLEFHPLPLILSKNR